MAVGSIRRVTRATAVVVVAALLGVLGLAAPASAHTVGGVGATNFHTTLSALTPAVAGVSLRVIENGSRLELRNDTGIGVVVAGYSGEPYARVGPGGVYLNDNSPATYLNVDRYSSTPVPAGVDGKSAPVWRQVSTDPVWRWHDHRVHWMLRSLPPAVAADPAAPHRISNWTVVLDQAGQRLTATGSLDWIPGPSPLPWLALALVAALAVAGLAFLARPGRLLAVATASLVAVDLVHRVGVMLVISDTVPARLAALLGGDSLLVWPFAILGGVLLWHRHVRAVWLSALAAALTVVSLAIDDVPVLWRSSAPTALASTVDRTVVSLVLGIGVGLVAALPLLLSRHRPPDRPWTRVPPAAAPARAKATTPGGPEAGTEDGVPAELVSSAESGDPDGTGTAGVGRRQVAGYLAAGALGALAGVGAGMAASGYRPSTAPGG